MPTYTLAVKTDGAANYIYYADGCPIPTELYRSTILYI